MEKKELKRKYLFSDAKLVLLGNTKIAFMLLKMNKLLNSFAKSIVKKDKP